MSHLILYKLLLSLRVLSSVVFFAEEGKNTDNQTHHHKQRQCDPEKSPTHRDFGTNAAKVDEELLHPPVKTINLHYENTKLYGFIKFELNDRKCINLPRHVSTLNS